jgi:RNA-directed DNA polymerase
MWRRSWEEVADLLAALGLRLSVAKSRTCHINEGLDFLGYHIQRRLKRGTSQYYVYTYPSKKALASITGRVRAMTNRRGHRTLADLLHQLNLVLRGWCNYFRYGVSAATFHYLDAYTWRRVRVTLWLRKQHPGINWKTLRRRYLTGQPGWRPAQDGITLFAPQQVAIVRYLWRGYRIPTPWASTTQPVTADRS